MLSPKVHIIVRYYMKGQTACGVLVVGYPLTDSFICSPPVIDRQCGVLVLKFLFGYYVELFWTLLDRTRMFLGYLNLYNLIAYRGFFRISAKSLYPPIICMDFES